MVAACLLLCLMISFLMLPHLLFKQENMSTHFTLRSHNEQTVAPTQRQAWPVLTSWPEVARDRETPAEL